MKEKIILVGGGGHCHSCIDVIESDGRFEIVGIVDSNRSLGDRILSNYKVIGSDSDLPKLISEYKNALITVGQIKSPEIRVKLYEILKNLNANLPVIISKRAYVASSALIGEGTIVMHDALINANAIIGVNSIINTKSLCEHDVKIGNHCHISTGSIINGGTKIGNRVFIGSNAVIRNSIEISDDSIISFGDKK